VTSRRQVEAHRRSLAEIRNIMNAMKNLAYMETRKLARCLAAQTAVVSSIEDVAADFVTANPQALPDGAAVHRAYLLVGSERGFCGNFNEALLDRPELDHRSAVSAEPPLLIVTGRKLHALIDNDARAVALLDGANVVEEVAAVLTRLVEMLAQLQTRYGVLSLHALYHAGGRQDIVVQPILPPFERYRHQPERFTLPPLLNLEPADFLIELSDHYLFAVLHQIFYASLMAENERRVQHLDAAVDHLEQKSLDLQRRANALRQEEIIEEIEVILLSRAECDARLVEQERRDRPQG
jgi:F-type H+-transporting ATPase subunit gamma